MPGAPPARASPSPRPGEEYAAFAARLRLRGDPGPAARHRGGAGRHGRPQAHGPGGLRRCRLRQDRGRHARRLHGRRRRAPGRRAGAHHPARPAALRELLRPLRRLADQGREPVALSHRQGAEGILDGLANGTLDIVVGTHKLCSPTSSSRTWGWPSSTRSTASGCATRSR